MNTTCASLAIFLPPFFFLVFSSSAVFASFSRNCPYVFSLVQIYSLWQQLMVLLIFGGEGTELVRSEGFTLWFGFDYFPHRMMKQAGLAVCVCVVCACLGHGLHP